MSFSDLQSEYPCLEMTWIHHPLQSLTTGQLVVHCHFLSLLAELHPLLDFVCAWAQPCRSLIYCLCRNSNSWIVGKRRSRLHWPRYSKLPKVRILQELSFERSSPHSLHLLVRRFRLRGQVGWLWRRSSGICWLCRLSDSSDWARPLHRKEWRHLSAHRSPASWG